MSGFGNVAVKSATELSRSGGNPRDVWDKNAIIQFGVDSSMRIKGCPKSTFLTLCQEGNILGVAIGKYTNARENRVYALKAIGILKETPQIADHPKQLWIIISEGKTYNYQTEVICELFLHKLLIW